MVKKKFENFVEQMHTRNEHTLKAIQESLAPLSRILECNSLSNCALGERERLRLEKYGKIKNVEIIENYDAIFTIQQQAQAKGCKSEAEFFDFIAPILNAELECCDMVFIDSHSHPWLSQYPNLSDDRKLRPEAIAIHRGMYEKKAESSILGAHTGIRVPEIFKCLIVFECKKDIDDDALDQIVRYVQHICIAASAGAVLFDREWCWLLACNTGRPEEIKKVMWASEGSKSVFRKFINDYKSSWVSLLTEACAMLGVEVVDGNSFLGRGAHGMVFRVAKESQVLALKIVQEKSTLHLQSEAFALKLAHETGLTTCCVEDVIEMTKGAALLTSPVGSPVPYPKSKSGIRNLFEHLRKLHMKGLIHGDPRVSNVIKVDKTLLWIDLLGGLVKPTPTLRKLDACHLSRSILQIPHNIELDENLQELLTEYGKNAWRKNLNAIVDKVAELKKIQFHDHQE
jgi:tRNA A-37 threonylcarbamoyl transferase component Bud32